jgi:hypothetical protein
VVGLRKSAGGFLGTTQRGNKIIPVEKFLEVAKQAMGREVLKSELADREALVDELSARIPAKTLDEVRAKITAQNATDTRSRQVIHPRSPNGYDVSRKNRSRSSLE